MIERNFIGPYWEGESWKVGHRSMPTHWFRFDEFATLEEACEFMGISMPPIEKTPPLHAAVQAADSVTVTLPFAPPPHAGVQVYQVYMYGEEVNRMLDRENK